MQDIYSTISIICAIISIAGMLGGFVVFRSSLNKSASEIQERVINTMEQELQVLRDRIVDLETENKRLDQVFVTMCDALKKRGIIVTIDGNMITFSDGKDTSSVRITGA